MIKKISLHRYLKKFELRTPHCSFPICEFSLSPALQQTAKATVCYIIRYTQAPFRFNNQLRYQSLKLFLFYEKDSHPCFMKNKSSTVRFDVIQHVKNVVRRGVVVIVCYVPNIYGFIFKGGGALIASSKRVLSPMALLARYL